MRRGFILPIIILAVIIGVSYFLYSKYSKVPNGTTQGTAGSIYKYPNSETWQIKPHSSVCLEPKDPCGQPVDIIFTSNDSWPTIYNYYKTYLIDYGWNTNSTVYTSIPTSIVFDKEGCKVSLDTGKPINFLNDKAPSPPYKYIFTVICQ